MSARAARAAGLDEGLLYTSGTVALVAAQVAAAGGAGSWSTALVASGLVAAGAVMSWRTRALGMRWLPLNIVLALAAAGSFALLVHRELALDESSLSMARTEVGLLFALRMALLPIALSYLLVKHDLIAFSLVPSLAMFGLAGGQGSGAVVGPCFAVFLPAALVALSYGMVLSALPGPSQTGGREWRLTAWRTRHWAALGVSLMVIGVLAYALFFPIAAVSAQYRWQLIAGIAPAAPGMGPQVLNLGRSARSFPVGRGPLRPSDEPALTIVGEPAPLWRGAAFDLYTGHAWLRSEESLDTAGAITQSGLDLTDLFPPPPGVPVHTHLVRSEKDQVFVCYSAGQIRRIGLPPTAGSSGIIAPSFMRVDEYGCVDAPGHLMRTGFEYVVASSPLEISAFRSRDPDLVSPSQLPENYLKLPFSCRRVADLARRLTAREAKPERRLATLAAYLQRHCVYTLEAPAAPRSQDAVDHFLFHSRRGYCDLFASALAVMARAVGIPTRVVVGYAYPSPVVEEPGDPPTALVRESDAHAWVEAYVVPWGWVSVDATPPSGESSPIPLARRTALRAHFLWQDHPVAAGGTLTLILVGLVLALLRRRTGLAPATAAEATPEDEIRAAVVQAYARSLRLLRRLGLRRRPSQTPLEFLTAISSDGVATRLATALSSLTDLFLVARYSSHPLEQGAADEARRQLAEIRQHLRQSPRRG